MYDLLLLIKYNEKIIRVEKSSLSILIFYYIKRVTHNHEYGNNKEYLRPKLLLFITLYHIKSSIINNMCVVDDQYDTSLGRKHKSFLITPNN